MCFLGHFVQVALPYMYNRISLITKYELFLCYHCCIVIDEAMQFAACKHLEVPQHQFVVTAYSYTYVTALLE